MENSLGKWLTLLVFGLWMLSCIVLTSCGKAPRSNFSSGSQPEQDEMIRLVNEARSSGRYCGQDWMPAVGQISSNSLLAASAQGHASDMETQNYFSHTSEDGRSLSDRVNASGYRWNAIGENIAKGQRSASEAVQDWLESEGHCRNIMNSKFSEMGYGRSGVYWVQNFGRSQTNSVAGKYSMPIAIQARVR